MIPFFPPDLFNADLELLRQIVYDIGTAPEQRFILGAHTARLERELAAVTGAADVVACGSGTGGLTLILHALGIGPGDEVVVPAFGCAPLAATVVNLGATPVFADIDPETLTVDPSEVERLVAPRTRAVMPAHIFSMMADMPRLADLAARAGLHLIEDSAVAQGATLQGRAAGLWGDAGVYSFVQVKSFGMPGEGGAVVTRDADLGARIRLLRNHGQDGVNRFRHHRIGYNSRFDEIQAAFQVHRLSTLADRLARRAEIAHYYNQRFSALCDDGIHCPPSAGDGRCFYVYTLQSDRRDALQEHLATRAVGTHVYYPNPLPSQPAFARFARSGTWPRAESACERTLSLPIYPHLTDAQVEYVADAVCGFARVPVAA